MASIHASEATLAALKAAFPHVVLCFIPPRSTSYLQPCDVAVIRSFMSCIQAQAIAALARSVLDGSFEGLAIEQRHGGFGRTGISRSHGPLRREQGVDNWMASLARRQQRRVPRGRRRGRGTPTTSSRSPLPKTPWNGPWQRRQTMKTTRPSQTRRMSRS